MVQTHEGPLPPPNILAGYGQVNASFPERIMAMAEANAKTERLTARREQTFQLAEELTGRVLGAAFAIAVLLLATWLAIHGHDAVAGVMAGTTVLGVSIALITGKKS